MTRLAILGCGRIGRVHAHSIMLHPGAMLAAVSDATNEAALQVSSETGALVRSVEEILADSAIHGVVICTPTDTHADLIERAARAGKAILCEKPVDLSSERIQRCLETIKPFNVPLMIGFNRRFDANFAALQERVREGQIGDIELVTITSRDPSPPPIEYISRSGGIFRDMMIHDLDLARFILGEEPIEVHAVASALIDPAIEEAGDADTAAVMLKTASGKICQISCSRRATYGYDQRVEILGSRGLLRAGNVSETTVEHADRQGFRTDPILPSFLERYGSAYKREIDCFIQSIKSPHLASPTGYDGLRAQILADAASEAVRARCVVSLSQA